MEVFVQHPLSQLAFFKKPIMEEPVDVAKIGNGDHVLKLCQKVVMNSQEE